MGFWACLVASPADAQTHRLEWDDGWERVHEASYVIAPLLATGAVLTDRFVELGPPRWQRAGLIDEGVREALRAREASGRERAARLSDLMLLSLMLWPFVDSVGVAGLGDQNSDVFWQLSVIGAQSALIEYSLSLLIKLLVHRARPSGSARCRDCNDSERWYDRGRGFWSGHTSAAFNAAGVICVSHANLPLYADSAADAFACGAAVLSASVVGLLRIIADRHYASDVLVGALVGLATGALLPWAAYFAGRATPAPADGLPGPGAMTMPLLGGGF